MPFLFASGACEKIGSAGRRGTYFLNSKSEADFFEIGMELKSSPLKRLKNNEYRSKERLVLSIIDYLKIVEQSFEESDFWKKNANILLIF